MEIKNAYQSEYLTTKLVANNSYFCNAAIKKDCYHTWAADLNIQTPARLKLNKLKNGDTVVLKKNGGFGSKDTKIVKYQAVNKYNQNEITAYKHIDGDEYTIDCYPLNGRAITTIRKRVEVKNGVCIKAKITQNEQLTDTAQKLVDHFHLNHPFCFQVIKQNSEYYLIDLNPRLGGGTSLSAATGRDYFSAHIAYILNLNVEDFLDQNIDSCIVTRQYTNYLMKVL